MPLYRRLAGEPDVDLTVIYASNAGVRSVDEGFGETIKWDVDLIGGYRSVFVRRANSNPSEQVAGFFAYRDWDIIDQIISGHFHVLYLWGNTYLTHQLALITQRIAHRALVFGEDQTLLHARPVGKLIAKRILLTALYRQGHAVYCGTENMRYFRHYGVPAKRLHFSPHCVDNVAFQDAARRLNGQKHILRRRFGIDQAGPVVLMVARLIPKKQPYLLIDAFRIMREHNPAGLLIVGSGQLEKQLKAYVERFRIPDVVFAGFLNQTEMPAAYAASDIFAMPSGLHETWGLAVNEAMNFGLPIVVTDKVGCGADLVESGSNGYVVSADDPMPMARALEALVRSPRLRARFGNRSREIIGPWNYDRAAAGVLEAAYSSAGIIKV